MSQPTLFRRSRIDLDGKISYVAEKGLAFLDSASTSFGCEVPRKNVNRDTLNYLVFRSLTGGVRNQGAELIKIQALLPESFSHRRPSRGMPLKATTNLSD